MTAKGGISGIVRGSHLGTGSWEREAKLNAHLRRGRDVRRVLGAGEEAAFESISKVPCQGRRTQDSHVSPQPATIPGGLPWPAAACLWSGKREIASGLCSFCFWFVFCVTASRAWGERPLVPLAVCRSSPALPLLLPASRAGPPA